MFAELYIDALVHSPACVLDGFACRGRRALLSRRMNGTFMRVWSLLAHLSTRSLAVALPKRSDLYQQARTDLSSVGRILAG